MTEPTYYYRYYDGSYADEGPKLEKLLVTRRTACGVFVQIYAGAEKFINNSWNKRYAWPTIAGAQASYIARKKRQIKLLETQLEKAKSNLVNAELGRWDLYFNTVKRVWQEFNIW